VTAFWKNSDSDWREQPQFSVSVCAGRPAFYWRCAIARESCQEEDSKKADSVSESAFPRDMISSEELFPAEDFLQQVRRLRRGVFANLLFFLSKHVEKAVERFANDVFVEIEFVGEEAGSR